VITDSARERVAWKELEYMTWSQCRERERETDRVYVWLQRKILYITSFLHREIKETQVASDPRNLQRIEPR